MRQTFNKEERLKKQKLIDILFSSKNSFFVFPYKIMYCEINDPPIYPVQLLISVSKRNFKKAVDRNYIKRLTREAYRKNKEILYTARQDCKKLLLIGLIYTGKTIPDYSEVEQKLILILHRLKEKNGTDIG